MGGGREAQAGAPRLRSGAGSKDRGAVGCCAGGRLTWSQCPSLAESSGRTLFIRLGENLEEPCVQLAYRGRRGDCRRGGTWLLAAWLILSRKVPFAGPEDRHESQLRKAATIPSASGSLALSFASALLLLLPPPHRARSVRSRGDQERGGWRMEREVQVRGGLRAGRGGGRPRQREGLRWRWRKMNGGATAWGRGGRSLAPGWIPRSVLYIFRRRKRRERRRGRAGLGGPKISHWESLMGLGTARQVFV